MHDRVAADIGHHAPPSAGHRRLLVAASLTSAAAILGVVLLVTSVAGQSGLAADDPAVTAAFIGQRASTLTVIARFFTFLGGTASLTVLTLAVVIWLIWRRRARVPAFVVGVTMAVSAGLTSGLKLLWGRARPPAADVLGTISTSYSFPSGHALNSMVFFGLMAGLALPVLTRLRARVLVIAGWLATTGAIGLSRIYLGYHWMTDVLAGWCTGLAILGIVTVLVLRSPLIRAQWHPGVARIDGWRPRAG